MDPTAELEIGLYRWDAEHYAVDLRYNAPGREVDVRPRQSGPVSFDADGLRRLAQDPDAYGALLWRCLFADDNVRETFAECRTHADTAVDEQGRPRPLVLRVRLYVSPNAPEMHALRWETLRHPDDNVRLVTSERTLFSRYLLSADWRPIRPAPDGPAGLKVLLAVADPSDLAGYRPGGRPLDPVDVAGESARARHALAALQVTELSRLTPPGPGGTPPRATLDGLVEGIRAGCDVVYLVCHGALPRGEPVLYLEDPDGRVDTVTGTELVERLREVREQPRLAVLASCQSAGAGGAEPSSADGGALSALGPRLVEAGVPAVLAMQGNVTMATVEAFMPTFFAELLRDGQIDRAAAVARGRVRDRPDWWAPVLFLRLRGGNLWGGPPGRPPSFPRWDALLANLRKGNCTPVLGTGMLEPLIGTTREIARRWAEAYRFPLAPQNRDDLPQVSQFLEVTQDRAFPRAELESYLMPYLRRRFAADLQQLPPESTLDDLLVAAGRALQRRDPNEPHALLASLPFPVFITTNGDSLLEQSLRDVKLRDGQAKQPLVGIFHGPGGDPGAEAPPAGPPTPARPLVYHLFGHLGDPDSLVLTEDDYFDYLIGLSARRRQIPDEVRRRLTRSSLLFLGFRLEEWDFRVLVRSINALEGSDLLRQYAQIAVQVDPEGGRFLDPDSARRYLEGHTRFGGSSISVYWGRAEEFLKELRQRWQAQQPGS